MPTRLPARASPIAIETAIVLLPTPPFPEPTAITLLASSPIWPSFVGARSWGVTVTVTVGTAGKAVRSRSSIRPRVCFQRMAEWLVKPTSTAMQSAVAVIAPTCPRSVSGRPDSGSAMSAKMLRTASVVGALLMASAPFLPSPAADRLAGWWSVRSQLIRTRCRQHGWLS